MEIVLLPAARDEWRKLSDFIGRLFRKLRGPALRMPGVVPSQLLRTLVIPTLHRWSRRVVVSLTAAPAPSLAVAVEASR